MLHGFKNIGDKSARFHVSYYFLQVFQQAVGHNTQAVDLSEQANQVLARMTTDLRGHVVDLCAAHTCRESLSLRGLFDTYICVCVNDKEKGGETCIDGTCAVPAHTAAA